MNILVTGGAGFIGSRLCHFLVSQNHRVTCYDNLSLGRRELVTDLETTTSFRFLHKDLLTDKELDQTVADHELVIHLAANSDISRGSQITDLDLNTGFMTTYKLLESMRKTQVKKIIFASTSAIYGEVQKIPTPEAYGPLIPISLYGASKLCSEAFISAFCHNYQIQSWIFRFANIVGPNLTHGIIFDLLNKLRKKSSTLQVLGNGRQKKSYLHVDDCIDGMWFAFHHAQEKVNIYNLANQGTTEVRWIAEKLIEKWGKPVALNFENKDRGWTGDVPVAYLDPSQLKALGWHAKLSSDRAIELAIDEALKS